MRGKLSTESRLYPMQTFDSNVLRSYITMKTRYDEKLYNLRQSNESINDFEVTRNIGRAPTIPHPLHKASTILTRGDFLKYKVSCTNFDVIKKYTGWGENKLGAVIHKVPRVFSLWGYMAIVSDLTCSICKGYAKNEILWGTICKRLCKTCKRNCLWDTSTIACRYNIADIRVLEAYKVSQCFHRLQPMYDMILIHTQTAWPVAGLTGRVCCLGYQQYQVHRSFRLHAQAVEEYIFGG